MTIETLATRMRKLARRMTHDSGYRLDVDVIERLDAALLAAESARPTRAGGKRKGAGRRSSYTLWQVVKFRQLKAKGMAHSQIAEAMRIGIKQVEKLAASVRFEDLSSAKR